jgi:hypothetical protein
MARPRLAPLIPLRFRDWLSEVLVAAELVAVIERIAACRDPKDDKFLELAVNGHADLIVTGDADLLALNPFREIPIISPATFVQGIARLSDHGEELSYRMERSHLQSLVGLHEGFGGMYALLCRGPLRKANQREVKRHGENLE